MAHAELIRTYEEAQLLLEAKRRLLNSVFPFTVRDELDLHTRLMAHANSSIALMEILMELGGMQRQTWPECHKLLRAFRNTNHHERYAPFRPSRPMVGRGQPERLPPDFYVWPSLWELKEVKHGCGQFAAVFSRLTLTRLLQDNQAWCLGLPAKAPTFLAVDGRFKIPEEYRLGELFTPEENPYLYGVPASAGAEG